MILTINGIQSALKKGSSIEYVSENRLFTDADDYSMDAVQEIVKPRKPEIPGSGASIWKRDPVGTNE